MHSFPVASVATAAARTATRLSAAAVGGAGGGAQGPSTRAGPSLARAHLPRPCSSPAAAGGGDVPALTGGRARRAEPAARGRTSELSINTSLYRQEVSFEDIFY